MQADIVTEAIKRLTFKASREIRDRYGAHNYLLEVCSGRLYFAAMDQGGNTVAEMSLEGLTINDLDSEPSQLKNVFDHPMPVGERKGRVRAQTKSGSLDVEGGSLQGVDEQTVVRVFAELFEYGRDLERAISPVERKRNDYLMTPNVPTDGRSL